MSIFLKKNFVERMAVILIVLGIILGLLFLISTSTYFRSILLLIAIIIIIIVGFILMSYLSAKEENSPRIHMRRGMQYEDWRQYDKAIEEYNKVLAIDPNIQLAYKCLGDVHKEKSQFDVAIENYTRALAINPDDDWSYYQRGMVYFIIAQESEFYSKKGKVYKYSDSSFKADKDNYDRAIDDFNKTITINPNHDFAHYYLGRVYKKKEQFEKAIEICNKAIALGFAFIGTFETRGIAYTKKGQYDMAIEDLSKFLLESNINTDEAGEAYYHRGLTYMKKGQYDMAIEDFKIACEAAYEDACSKLKDLLKTE